MENNLSVINNSNSQVKEMEKADTQKDKLVDNKVIEGSNESSTSPTVPTPSSPTNGQTEKKSYKLALTKEAAATTTNNSTEKATEKPAEAKPPTPKTDQTPEPIADPNKPKEVNSNIPRKNNSSNAISPKSATQPSQPWKNNNNNNKKKKKEDEENLTDFTSWPSLEEVKTEPPKEKKPTGKKEESEMNGTTESHTENNSNEQVTSPKESDQNNKKKGVNWVPLEIEAPRQHSQRGRGSRGRGGNQNPNNPMNKASWRSQNTPNTNSRGGNRRGRGGYNGTRNYPPASTVYFAPNLDAEGLKTTLLKQIEYYFSVENLCKDVYLRGQMDEEGWIPLSLIAAFNRVKILTPDVQIIKEVLQTSTLLEFTNDKIRKKEDWKTWLIPKDQQVNSITTPTTTTTTNQNTI